MSKRKYSHLLKLRREVAGARERLRAYERKIIKEGCWHPDFHTRMENRDDGYGKWWQVEIDECRVCGQQINIRRV